MHGPLSALTMAECRPPPASLVVVTLMPVNPAAVSKFSYSASVRAPLAQPTVSSASARWRGGDRRRR